MLALLAMTAYADGPELGVLTIPITPSEFPGKEFHGMVQVKDASGEWKSDAKGFECRAVDDHIEVMVRSDDWPSVIPKKVTCTSSSGKKAKLAVVVDWNMRYESMFVGDGTLVMPRRKGHSSIYEGSPPPGASVRVGVGKSASLDLVCKIEPGSKLKVQVSAEHPDGDGRCSLKDTEGKPIWIDIKIVTIKK